MLMTRRLYRSRTDTVLGGVAAGLANYLNADPAVVRIAWAILVPITGGAALLAYVVAWIVIPEEPASAPTAGSSEPGSMNDADEAASAMPSPSAAGPDRAPRNEGRANLVVGIGLVLIGLWFLVREYLPPINWSLVWPAILIGIGVLILLTSARRRT
jgi:phage shock protein C